MTSVSAHLKQTPAHHSHHPNFASVTSYRQFISTHTTKRVHSSGSLFSQASYKKKETENGVIHEHKSFGYTTIENKDKGGIIQTYSKSWLPVRYLDQRAKE